MENTQKLKEQAHALEKRDDLPAALEIFQRLADEAGDDPGAAGLWHRVADLQLRLTDPQAAVRSLERAVHLYREADLANNALALSHRILRIDPDATSAYLTLGRIAAAQGYRVDARNAYLEYVDRASAAGDQEDSDRALRELVEHFPGDEDLRRRVVDRLGEDALPAPPSEPPAAASEPAPEPVGQVRDDPGVAAEPEDDAVAPLEGLEPTHLFEEPEEAPPAADEEPLPLVGNLEEPEELEEPGEEPPADEDEPLPLLSAEPEEPAGPAEPEEAEPAPAPTPSIPSRSRDYVDLGALILGDELEEPTRFLADAEGPTGDEDRDLTAILNTFREQVNERLDRNDAASHYDLGLAFKEMGLLDDAVGQLQAALRGGANLLATLEVLGECYVEKGEPELASRVLQRATQLDGTDEVDLVGVHYWLGRCAEASGEFERAAEYLEKVVAVDEGFRDAGERLEAIRAF